MVRTQNSQPVMSPTYRSVLGGPVVVAALLVGIAWMVFHEPISPPKPMEMAEVEPPPVVVDGDLQG